MSRLHSFAATIVLGVLAAGCSDGTDVGTPPVLPEAESMEFDLSFFGIGGSPAPQRAPSAVAGVSRSLKNLAVRGFSLPESR
jgi:hypothetical protein